jgi:uncharacterized protein YqhQ
VRGAVALWDALGLGMRFLTMSANLQAGEDEKIEGKGMVLTVGLSMLIAAGLFFATPAFLGHLAQQFLSIGPFLSNMVEGLIRLALIIGYIFLVGRMPEIARVFAYHGAEHKTINAYERRAELSPNSVLMHSLEHPRCGTAFLLTLVIVSILFFTLMGPMPGVLRVVSRLVFLPLLAGIAYEYIRWTARHLDNPLVRMMIRPNLALQRLTTREPDAAMAEVSITAFNAMLEMEAALEAAAQAQPAPGLEKAASPY